MLYIIKSEEKITEVMASQWLSDMTQLVADIDDSSHLRFNCVFASDYIVLYELPDSPFTTKLRGVSVLMVGPNPTMNDIQTYRTWKQRGEDFAKFYVEVLQSAFDVKDLNIIEHDDCYYFVVHDVWIRTAEYVANSLKLYLDK